MSSYLAAILSSAEKVEMDYINAKCPEVATAVETCKTEVLSYLENIYVLFSERPRQNKSLADKINLLQKEISDLVKRVEDLPKDGNEVEKHLDLLCRVDITVNFIGTMFSVHEALVEISKLQSEESFLECMKNIKDTGKYISSLKLDENLPVIEEMSLNLKMEESALVSKLSSIFKTNIITKSIENKSVIEILDENEIMKEVLSALYFCKSSITPLDNVATFLWDYVFIPVVDYTTEVEVISNDGYVILEISTVDYNKKSSYVEVFNNIKTILSFLLSYFNIDLNDDVSTLSYIGREICGNLSELIINHCLQDTISSTNDGLQEYKVVIEATKDLEEILVMSKFFDDDTKSILAYANNFTILFINEKCRDYMIQAQNLMKEDLYDMIEVGEEETSIGVEATAVFPRSMISRSVIDILNLLQKILLLENTTSSMCTGSLFCTVRNICQNYITYVPEHHKKSLQSIPLQTAVFYNNCMYMSHKLTEWTETFLKKMPSVLNVDLDSFNDQGRQLREVACEKLTTYVNSQIEEFMKELWKNDIHSNKSLSECLCQLELLKTVWHKVLPYNIYNKTLGTILDSFCQYVISFVVQLEDISLDVAEQLVELFKMVQTRGSKLFDDPEDVSLFVGSWVKLEELAFVLNGTLVDINDRWADGRGPLALQFKAEELRQLVKALFKNSERRAAVLAKIHD